MFIKDWFLEKNFNQNERYVMSFGEYSIEKESEKAILVKWHSDYGCVTRWIPKSCILGTEEEKENRKDWENEKMQRESEKATAELKRLEKGLNYNQQLVAFAKENNVKGVRVGMKTFTLIKKIEEAGLEVPKNM